MKIISLFKFFILPFSLILFLSSNTSALTLEKTPISLNAAWGMTWLDDTQMLITQKSGEIFLVDTVDHTQIEISHNIPVVQYGQGGLLDIINEGNMGLIKAAKRFDDTRGFKFISYAVWWIRQSILQALAEQSRLIRLPLNRVGTITKITRAAEKLEAEV